MTNTEEYYVLRIERNYAIIKRIFEIFSNPNFMRHFDALKLYIKEK